MCIYIYIFVFLSLFVLIYRLSRRHPQKDRVVYFYLFIITKNTKLNKGEKGIYQQQQNKDSNSFLYVYFFFRYIVVYVKHTGWGG